MTGTHVVEECPQLHRWRPRRAVWKDWREALGGRAVSKKEAEEEGDLLGAFFFRIYEFHFSFSIHLQSSIGLLFLTGTQSSLSPRLIFRYFLELLLLFLLRLHLLQIFLLLFPDYSVVSSVDFVPASASTPPCIGTIR